MDEILKSMNKKLDVKRISPELNLCRSQVYRIGAGERNPTVEQVLIYLELGAEAKLPETYELLKHFTQAAGCQAVRREAIERAVAATIILLGGPQDVGKAA
jgi:hypothetical protein